MPRTKKRHFEVDSESSDEEYISDDVESTGKRRYSKHIRVKPEGAATTKSTQPCRRSFYLAQYPVCPQSTSGDSGRSTAR